MEPVYPGSTSHNGVFLASDIKRVMTKLFYVTISAVGTDNTATNQLMWSALQKDPPHGLYLTRDPSNADASSAAAKRTFSTHTLIHLDVTNRLSEAHVAKLVFIFFNSNDRRAEDMATVNLLKDLEAESSEEESSNQNSIYEYTRRFCI
ncbi:hypothetical protein PR001_g22135 [Phytophthora rubi]|uniref:Uncharacterized protein n=1 Tax=Phytophthora rubi TaxID=129364 RepID=A0A6A3J1C3_9STRA|nr:hypothetical protein PR001_g22135 [Phytophthora rubi]